MEPFETYVREWPVISHAPLSALTIILGSGPAGFAAGYFIFRERLETLKERLTHRDERIAELANRPPVQAADPVPAPARLYRRHDAPDTRLDHAFGYMSETEWGRDHNMEEAAIERELRDKLHLELLTAFARAGPDGNLDPIEIDIWQSVRLNPTTRNAEMEDGTVSYYDVQFNMNALRTIWPTWRDTFGL